MNNIKNAFRGFLILSLLAGAAIALPVSADNKPEAKGYLKADASLKADLSKLESLESVVGIVLGQNSALRVTGARVDSVSGSEIKATAPFGNASLSFTVRADAETKVNGKVLGSSYASVIDDLKAGDKISFSGNIVSSSSSSLTVEANHLVSQALYDEAKDDDNDSDEDEDEDDDENDDEDEKSEKGNNGKSWFGKFRNWFWK